MQLFLKERNTDRCRRKYATNVHSAGFSKMFVLVKLKLKQLHIIARLLGQPQPQMNIYIYIYIYSVYESHQSFGTETSSDTI